MVAMITSRPMQSSSDNPTVSGRFFIASITTIANNTSSKVDSEPANPKSMYLLRPWPLKSADISTQQLDSCRLPPKRYISIDEEQCCIDELNAYCSDVYGREYDQCNRVVDLKDAVKQKCEASWSQLGVLNGVV